ncbi:MAG: hypothetical protein ACN6O5_23700 [Achromobacter sp.]|uniref:hypothetical protein n=1 Tax=unclassified Achromobacter TaxID=2626865 RepID=UPI0006FF5C6A|nr:hypothetical protein [Achromobacter sp. Root565]KRA02542.1 hypothetical protein ASD71_11120 [Achromobacter sp. Root565]
MMGTTKQLRQYRPTFREVQRKWRLFRFASTLLPLDADAHETPAIEATRFNENCIEVISDTLQTGKEGELLRIFTFSGIFLFFYALIGGFGGWSAGVLILSLGLPGIGFLSFFIPRVLRPRYRYRCSKVRFDRRSRRVYYVPYPEESSEAVWELDWDQLLGIQWSTGQAQPYLYLVGYTCNLPEPQLVKIPVIFNEKIFGTQIWAWLHLFMDKVGDLPPPKIILFPQNPGDVLMRYGGRRIFRSLTTRKGRLWLPLMIWVDLAILLLYMPSWALPQLIVLKYPEIQFPEENNRHCGFSTG